MPNTHVCYVYRTSDPGPRLVPRRHVYARLATVLLGPGQASCEVCDPRLLLSYPETLDQGVSSIVEHLSLCHRELYARISAEDSRACWWWAGPDGNYASLEILVEKEP